MTVYSISRTTSRPVPRGFFRCLQHLEHVQAVNLRYRRVFVAPFEGFDELSELIEQAVALRHFFLAPSGVRGVSDVQGWRIASAVRQPGIAPCRR